MKKILSLGLLTLIFSLGANNVNAVPFNYKYEIRTNSLSYNDQLMGYSYKKIFIEIYEKICLLLHENYHDEAIRKNIDKFKINKEIKCELKNGTLYFIIENGLGISIKGNFRKSLCDEENIDTRFFFYDIFE